MKFLIPAFAATALSCITPTLQAQSSTATEAAPAPANPGLWTRMSRWWDDDWLAGWDHGSTWRVTASPYTYHYSYSPEHTHVYMLGVERQRADGLLFGLSLFKNSFGQPSAYLYGGQRFDRLMEVDQLFAEVTGGVLYGYRPPFDHKVPLNVRGFSPGLVASLGWQLTPTWSGQVNVLGNSALMFQFSADFK
jgi:hypothetical protein